MLSLVCLLPNVGNDLLGLEKNIGVSNIQVLALPSVDKLESFYVDPQVIAYFMPEAGIDLISLFSLPIDHFGAQTNEKELLAFHFSEDKIVPVQIESSIRSKTRPLLFDNELIVQKDGSKSLSQMSIVYIDNKMILHEKEDIKCSSQPFIVSTWQKTVYDMST